MDALTAETVVFLRSYLDALTAGDVDAIREHFAQDATWFVHGDLPMSGLQAGRDQIVDFLLAAGSLYEPETQSFSFGDITAQGDVAVLEWNVRGIGRASGARYDNDYCGVFTIREGQIVGVREFFDTDHARHVLFGPGAGVGPGGRRV